MDNNKLEVLKLLATIADEESNRIWTRYQIMFYANTGLIAIAAWILDKKGTPNNGGFGSYLGFIAVLGMLLAVMWLASVVLGRYYERRLFADIKALIATDQFLREFIRYRNENEPRVSPPRLLNIVNLYGIIPILFLFFWSSILYLEIRLWWSLIGIIIFVFAIMSWYIYTIKDDINPD